MNVPALDARLKTVADLYPHCTLGADIGSDHAHLPCFLLKNNICDRMIVSDISPFSRQKAEKLMLMHCLENRAECIEANGLDAISGRNVQCVSITGMGGKLIAQLLQAGAAHLNEATLILSAHTDIPLVRRAVQSIGYTIIT